MNSSASAQIVRLKDIGNTFGGLTGKTGKDFGLGNSEYVTFLNVINNVIADPDLVEQVEIRAGEHQNTIKAGDLLFNGSSETPEEVGFPSVVTAELEGKYLNSFCFGFRFKSVGVLDPMYFAYYLRSTYGRAALSQLAQGSTRYNLSKTALLKLEWLVPPFKEQIRIAQTLSDIDALILRISELILKKKDIKQGLIQDLFYFNNVTTDRLNLKAFGEVIRGVSYKPENDLLSNDTNTSFRLLRSNNIFLSRINLDNTYIVSGNRVSQNQILIDGDILLCMANGSKQLVGKSALFLSNQVYNYTFGAFMGAYRPIESKEGLYISYLFQTERYRNLIELALAGSSINNLTPKAIMEMEFDFPGEQERSRISEILNAVDLELKSLEAERYKYECIKRGMMHDLLTGKVRLL